MKADSSSEFESTESLKSADFKLSDFSDSMTIGFDGKRAAQNFTGLGNYSRYIIEIMARYFPRNEYKVYSPREPDQQRAGYLRNLPSVSFRHPQSSVFKSLWRSFGIVRDLKNDGIDIYHGLSNEIPFGIKKAGLSTVVTIHDLIFLRYPHYYPWLDRKMYEFKFRYACRNADRIIAISEQTKRDVVDFFKIPERRIEVIYQNCNEIFRREVPMEVLKKIKQVYTLPDKYLLSVGTIEYRKNLMLIIKALKHVQSDVHLVIIGKETAYAKIVKRYIHENDLSHRVHFYKNVPMEDLPGIYRQAEIFVFPSEFEGFGIPIVEALHSRIPVIAASGSCLEEAGGPQSVYVNPADELALSEAIKLILRDPIKKGKMVTAGTQYAKQFTDELIAAKLMGLYQKLKRNA